MSTAAPVAPAVQHIERTCSLCGRDNHAAAAHPDAPSPWRLRTCRACGFVYLENPVAYAELEQNFAWEKQVQQRRDRNRETQPVFHKFRMLSRHAKRLRPAGQKLTALIHKYVPRGPVLDVGCGFGRVFAMLGQHTPYGIEIGRAQAKHSNAAARQRGGWVVQCDAVSGLGQFDPEFFSGVVLCSFLEHEAQPRELLEGVVRVLRPGGRVIIKVPNYACLNRQLRGPRWCGYRFPDHVNYFTPQTLASLVTSCGLQIIRFGLLDRLPVSDNMWCVASK